MNQQLLRRAWDALDSFKQAYPENWHEDDEQVMKDLMRADMSMSGVQLKWVGLTDEERDAMIGATDLSGTYYYDDLYAVILLAEGKLKEKNT